MTNIQVAPEKYKNEVEICKTYVYSSTEEKSLVYQVSNGYGDFSDAPEELLIQIDRVIDASFGLQCDSTDTKNPNGYVVIQKTESIKSFESEITNEFNILAGDFGNMHEMTRSGVLELQRLIRLVLQNNKENDKR